MGSYRVAGKVGCAEVEEKKSRFLGRVFPVRNTEEIREALEGIRKEHYKARHHCYAYILGEDGKEKHSSDDGEPSGTAGAPILKVIDGAGCTDTLIVVTRYFGGTLLGTGGLIRAYTQAAKEALTDAGIAEYVSARTFCLTYPYALHDRLLHLLQKEGISPEETVYEADVRMSVTVREEMAQQLVKELENLGNGAIKAEEKSRGFMRMTVTEEE